MVRPIVVASLAVVCLVTGFTASRLFAEDVSPNPDKDPKEAKVRKILELTGAEKAAKATMDKMMSQFDMMPGLPPGFSAKFKEKVTAKEMSELAIPVYVKLYDAKTLDAVIAFFESPEGKVFADKQPALMSEITDAGMEFGQRIAMEIVMELQTEGPAEPPAGEPR